MSEESTATTMTEPSADGFTVDTFAEFWAKPELTGADVPLAEDVIGDWPGEVVHGREDYVDRLAKLLAMVPDLHLDVAEHAQSGEYLFIRWVAHGTGIDGPFEFTGMDRIRVVDGIVTENVIRFDSAEFERLVGQALPTA